MISGLSRCVIDDAICVVCHLCTNRHNIDALMFARRDDFRFDDGDIISFLMVDILSMIFCINSSNNNTLSTDVVSSIESMNE